MHQCALLVTSLANSALYRKRLVFPNIHQHIVRHCSLSSISRTLKCRVAPSRIFQINQKLLAIILCILVILEDVAGHHAMDACAHPLVHSALPSDQVQQQWQYHQPLVLILDSTVDEAQNQATQNLS
jgi:hypothetical protein